MKWLWWLCLMVSMTTAASEADGGKFTGFVAAEVRLFANKPLFPEQEERLLSPSLVVQPEYRYTWNDAKDVLTAVPFFRLEGHDERRRHGDVRELNWLHIGSGWDLQVGVSKVFWGVAESRHLVDIINQTDLIEDVDEEAKLGQPLLKASVTPSWGTLSLFVLPYFRERTFPGAPGRLRPAVAVDTDRPVFASSLKQWHPDVALRWAHTVGPVDFGLAHFSGTGREPRLVPVLSPLAPPRLVPHYDLIHQTSLDLQLTTGNWAWKLEALTRSGQGKRFGAVVAGLEYTVVNVLETTASLGVLGEYHYDGRSAAAPTTSFDEDAFLGLRLALNDAQNTEALLGAILDRRTQATLLSLEASRRLGSRWRLEVKVRWFLNTPPDDLLFSVRRDDYVQFRLARYF